MLYGVMMWIFDGREYAAPGSAVVRLHDRIAGLTHVLPEVVMEHG